MTATQQLLSFIKSIFQWWVTIAPWQQGVRVRLGKNVCVLLPGIHLRLPIVDVVYMQPIRVRAQHVHSQTLTSSDGKAISVGSAIRYEITDLLTVYKTLHNAHDTIEQIVQSHIAGVVIHKKLEELSPQLVEELVSDAIDFSSYGLAVRGFNITDFAVVKTYRLIQGELGHFTGYDQRFETDLAMGEPNRN